MDFNSIKTSQIIFGITAIISSRVFFSLINDPEGPNLLIVMGLAVIIYFLSLAVYLLIPSINGLKKISLIILFQIIFVAVLHLFLH